MKFRVVEDCRDTWAVQPLCRVLGISTAGYYAWRSRPDSRRAIEDCALLADIRQAHANSGGRYGSPRVHATLRAQGAYSGDPDRLIQPKVIMQSGDRDHLPSGEGWQVAGAKEKCGRRL
ncbi:IS3 family transposase (plasmid) [Roseomonas mucosa]|nr:IS3 family transposase [Roseomonas mucosa]